MESRVVATEAELLEALRTAMEHQNIGPDDARTSREMAETTGWSDRRLMRALRALVRSGDMEHVQVMRANLCGVLQRIPAYRLTDRESKAA